MSADGGALVAARDAGPLYTSANAGVTWTPLTAAGSKLWSAITLSPDGTHLATSIFGPVAGSRFVYTATYGNPGTTTTGTAGSISGGPNDALQLQYLNSGQFGVLSSFGAFVIQ